jgi:hypothetical protein
VWADEPVDITATEALQAVSEMKSPSARDNAKHFLQMLFSNGEPIGSNEVHEAAKENGVSKKTLERAQQELGFNIKHDGPPNDKGAPTWRWHPPPKKEHAKCSQNQ